MKKTRFGLLALCLLLALCVPACAMNITHANKVLAREGSEAFRQLVMPAFGTPELVQKGYAQLRVTSPESPVAAQVVSEDLRPQYQYTIRFQETNGVGFTVQGIESYGCLDGWNEWIEAGRTELRTPVYVAPYGSASMGSGCPSGGNPRYEAVVAYGVDDNGHELEFYGLIERLPFMAQESASSAADPEHDTRNLRYLADYEVQVADGVWWVPAVSLGGSSYTNAQIGEMVDATPEEKQAAIHTLYEALQLFQIGGFYEGDDNQRIMEDGIDWEHHKPGYDAVRTNTGCCATDSNWLSYILRGDYDSVGFMAYSQSDGGGHVFNYIRQDGSYYFIDLTHYRTDFLDSSAPETGSMDDYRSSDFIAGNLHRADSPESYARYCRAASNDPPELFFLYENDDCLPVTGVHTGGGIQITYPNTVPITVVYDDPSDSLTYVFVDPPRQTYNWSALPTAHFRADERLIAAAPSTAAVSLPTFTPGDLLPFENYATHGFITVCGEDYPVAWNSPCYSSFKPAVPLYGGNNKGCYNHALPATEYAALLADLTSLCVGDFAIDVLTSIPDVQIVRCVEENSSLRVLSVTNTHNYHERIYYDRTATTWQPPAPLIYLIHYTQNNTLISAFSSLSFTVE